MAKQYDVCIPADKFYADRIAMIAAMKEQCDLMTRVSLLAIEALNSAYLQIAESRIAGSEGEA